MANYYEILEVNEKASSEVIDKAYRVLAKKYHPDVYQGDKKEAEQKMKKLNEAYDVLSDETKRQNYDSSLEMKRKIEQAKAQKQSAKEAYNHPSMQNSRPDVKIDYSNDTPLNNPSKYNKEEFVVDTTYMDEKQKKKIQKKLQERYVEAYDNYLRSRGYKLTYKWTFKRVMNVVLVIIISIAVFTILFFIPPIHSTLVDIYNSNIIVKILVDIIVSVFTAIFTAISSLFK